MRNLPGVAVIGFLVASTALAAPSSSSQKLALEALLKRSEATHSDAMVIWQDGREIGHYYKGGKAPGPIDLMSVTKSVVALGVAQLVAEGKIKSFDQPVADFYPEWRQGRKKNITIRMLMNHASGMQNVMNATVEIYPAPDAIQLALSAEIVGTPGTDPNYNNKAVNLLAGIIEKASGKPMDVFFRDGLFKSMDIKPGPLGEGQGGTSLWYGRTAAHRGRSRQGRPADARQGPVAREAAIARERGGRLESTAGRSQHGASLVDRSCLPSLRLRPGGVRCAAQAWRA